MNSKRQPNTTATATAADFLMASRQCEIRNLEYFLQMGRLVQSVGNLVHGLQRERGLPICIWGPVASVSPGSVRSS